MEDFAVKNASASTPKGKGYCRDCSIAHFGRDLRTFAQRMPQEGYSNETGALIHCSCCGVVSVDINGRRLDNQPYHPSCSCQEFTKRHSASTEIKAMEEK